MKLLNFMLALGMAFTVPAAWCQQPGFDDIARSRGIQDAADKEIQAVFEDALRANRKLFNDIKNVVDDLIARRVVVKERPKKEGFEGIRFKKMVGYWTTGFKTSEWFKPKSLKNLRDPGIRLLPCRVLDDINVAIKRAYKRGYTRYGVGWSGSTWQTISCLNVDTAAKEPSTLLDEFSRDEREINQLLDEAKAYWKEVTGGDPKKKISDKAVKAKWEAYVDKHKEILEKMEDLIDSYGEAAVAWSNRMNRERFTRAVEKYEQAHGGYNAHGFISVLPTEFQALVEKRIRNAYMEGIEDGVKAGVTFKEDSYVKGDYRYTCYTAKWLGRPIMRYCTTNMPPTVKTDGTRVSLVFMVQAPSDSFAHVSYYHMGSPAFEAGLSFIGFLLSSDSHSTHHSSHSSHSSGSDWGSNDWGNGSSHSSGSGNAWGDGTSKKSDW